MLYYIQFYKRTCLHTMAGTALVFNSIPFFLLTDGKPLNQKLIFKRAIIKQRLW